ncbi:hypothetical protein A9Q75_05940 [Colwellia psychrerythraea]|uniref:O-antigen polymerase n=1 Tax=Colwellia psychrerythraea TaxID=28229 RepID=A0A1Y5ENP6_COLPS|nr:hypothetical protein A9Q75_05940 [Colwellia psychrerythraea]
MTGSVKNSKSLTVLFLWLFLIYFPTYILGRSNSVGQILFFITYLLTALSVLLIINRSLKISFPAEEGISILLVFILIILSFIVKIPFSSIQELINHSRFLFYLLVFLTILNILHKSKVSPPQLKKGISVTILSLFAFNLMHVLVPDFISIINKRPIWDFRGISLGGPFVWSYIFSFFLIPFFYFYLHLLLSKFNFKNLFSVTFILICMLLGQSKACYIALAFTLVNYTLVSMYYKLDNRRKIYFGALCFCLVVITLLSVFPLLFSGVINGFTSLFSNEVDASTSGRLRQINLTLLSLTDGNISEFIFGVKVPSEIIENAYFSYFYKYGIVGVSGLILFYLYLTFVSYKYLNDAINRRYDLVSLSVILGFNAMVVSIYIFSLGASPIDANKSSYFFFFIWAVVLYIRKYNEKKLLICY